MQVGLDPPVSLGSLLLYLRRSDSLSRLPAVVHASHIVLPHRSPQVLFLPPRILSEPG
jgi:hypothetical protein